MLPQSGVYPADPKVKEPKPSESVFSPSDIRFRERAAKSGYKNAALLCAEAEKHVATGWLEGPAPPFSFWPP